MAITPPDIIISLILAFFTLNGFRHGFIEEMGRHHDFLLNNYKLKLYRL